MLIHVPNNGVGLADLGNFSEVLAGVPFPYVEHASFGIFLSRPVIQLPKKVVGVGGIGNKGGAIVGGTLGDNDIGAGCAVLPRSEERRVGKECRSWWSPHRCKQKNYCRPKA